MRRTCAQRRSRAYALDEEEHLRADVAHAYENVARQRRACTRAVALTRSAFVPRGGRAYREECSRWGLSVH